MTAKFQSSIKALILDMDGVLWRGNEEIGNLQSIFQKINQLGLKVVFATNNATRSIGQYVELLSSYGVPAERWQIVTSASAVVHFLKKQFPAGGPVYIIGEQGINEACTENGFYHSDTDALAVIAGMDRKLTYEKLRLATLLLRSGKIFIGTNPDHTFPTPQGLVPGAGAILGALTIASDVTPIIAGKPQPIMYQIALERLQLSAGQVLVVGDRPETDIAGAQAIGCHTALLLSGVTNYEQASTWHPGPDIITEDLESLVNKGWEQG